MLKADHRERTGKGAAMSGKLGWGITAWLALALIATCACASERVSIPVLAPVLIGLGVPAIVLLWQHREHLHKLLMPDRH